MKNAIFAFLLIASLGVTAQEKQPAVVKQGTKFYYTATADGQDVPLLITVDSLSADRVKLKWMIEGYGSGGWIMKKKSLESGTKGAWGEPPLDTDFELADDETVLLISRAAWDRIQKEKKTQYDGQDYSVKEAAETDRLKVNGKALDATLLVSTDGNTWIWVLNNPQFPAILKISGNTRGVDLQISNIE